jgi:putative DNA primase/helicase
VANGVIDLRDGTLRAPDPADMMTMQSPVPFEPEAQAPRWERALAEWFPDADVRSYVQRLAGAALVGRQRDHVVIIHIGSGRNGKGTFVRGLSVPFGPYAGPIHLSLLVQAKHGEHDTVKADLFRRRLAIAVETERQGHHLAEASVKNLTGGDRIYCRRMHQDPWSFEPSHSLWLQTNYLPRITGRDTGIWSRIRVVRWETSFERAPDKDLGARLENESAGILAWAVQGCLMWQRDGLNEPESVIRATLAYREAQDTLARFATDCGIVFGREHTYLGSTLNETLDEWCNSEGAKVSRADFKTWLEENGAKKRRACRDSSGKQPVMWDGVSIILPAANFNDAVQGVHGSSGFSYTRAHKPENADELCTPCTDSEWEPEP